MTAFDYIFLGILALSAAVGMWRGLVSELFALFAWLFALFFAWRHNEAAAQIFTGLISQQWGRQLAGVVLIVVVVLSVVALIKYLLRQLLRAAGLGTADRFFGAIFGIGRGLLFAWVLVVVGALAGLSRESWWTQAWFSPPLEAAVVASKPWLPALIADRIVFR